VPRRHRLTFPLFKTSIQHTFSGGKYCFFGMAPITDEEFSLDFDRLSVALMYGVVFFPGDCFPLRMIILALWFYFPNNLFTIP